MGSSLGERIRELRLKRGFTQDDMAEKLGMNRANFSNYERNLSIPPSSTLGKIADILGTTTDYLLGRTEDVQVSTSKANVAYFDGAKEVLTEDEVEWLKESLEMFRLRKAQKMKEAKINIIRPGGPPKSGPKK
ncbi:XRE family transcriptional regulator [Brevibacillus borstelensis]|uniref:helix-turn-helix domain-containing protein n=1 Tax=Brevibacillus borstelensis TaxID=45462 RepID=UPI00068F4BFE|nr:helix-turn-helix transcriptional regulator [Brevibacillus borstelensis]MED1881100.1 helix-turn-helix transcriptional regulator [Brevibacillus borstelensis]RNB66371.1 XRE family transcriptional regulator [Brevibacillus borstelensis]GED53503.1 HTH-type transcriptional regulator ImmR [Brevibacillus borstelensis]